MCRRTAEVEEEGERLFRRGTLCGRKIHRSHSPEDMEPKRRPEAPRNHLCRVDCEITNIKSKKKKRKKK